MFDVLDVLIYLFKIYIYSENEVEMRVDQNKLTDDLEMVIDRVMARWVQRHLI